MRKAEIEYVWKLQIIEAKLLLEYQALLLPAGSNGENIAYNLVQP